MEYRGSLTSRSFHARRSRGAFQNPDAFFVNARGGDLLLVVVVVVVGLFPSKEDARSVARKR